MARPERFELPTPWFVDMPNVCIWTPPHMQALCFVGDGVRLFTTIRPQLKHHSFDGVFPSAKRSYVLLKCLKAMTSLSRPMLRLLNKFMKLCIERAVCVS